jgi:hypothetical protein
MEGGLVRPDRSWKGTFYLDRGPVDLSEPGQPSLKLQKSSQSPFLAYSSPKNVETGRERCGVVRQIKSVAFFQFVLVDALTTEKETDHWPVESAS